MHEILIFSREYDAPIHRYFFFRRPLREEMRIHIRARIRTVVLLMDIPHAFADDVVMVSKDTVQRPDGCVDAYVSREEDVPAHTSPEADLHHRWIPIRPVSFYTFRADARYQTSILSTHAVMTTTTTMMKMMMMMMLMMMMMMDSQKYIKTMMMMMLSVLFVVMMRKN